MYCTIISTTHCTRVFHPYTQNCSKPRKVVERPHYKLTLYMYTAFYTTNVLLYILYCIFGNFQNTFIFGRTLCSENIIIERCVPSIKFWKAENVPNICLSELILLEIFIRKFHKTTQYTYVPCMDVCITQ